MSDEVEENLRVQLPSHMFKAIRSLPSARGRIIRGEGPTPIGTPHLGGRLVRNRYQSSMRRELDERDFALMAGDNMDAQPHEEIRNMATSLSRKKTVR